MFVGINFFRHEPRTVAPLQSIRWAKEFCLACNVKCMLFLSFLHVPMSVPPLGILYALPRRFSTASCPSPSPLTKDKDAERGWSRWKGVGGMGRWKGEMVGEVGWRWCEGGSRVDRRWSEGGARVEWRVECGECCQKLIPNTRIRHDTSILHLFRSFAWSTAGDSPLPFSLPRSFFSSLPLSTLLHFHLRSIPSFLFRKGC